jgi:hypothetical protein
VVSHAVAVPRIAVVTVTATTSTAVERKSDHNRLTGIPLVSVAPARKTVQRR